MDRDGDRIADHARRACRSTVVAALVGVAAGVGAAVAVGPEAPAAVGILGLIAAAGSDGGVDRLAAAIERIEDGEYDVEVEADRDDEVGRLSRSLESMARAVRERERALRERADEYRAERDRLSALFERTPDPVARVELVDEAVLVRRVNERFEAAFGPETAVRGESLFEHAGPAADSAIAGECRRSIARGEPVTHDFEVEGDDGTRTLCWRIVPVGDEGREAYVVYSDLTERVAARRAHGLDEYASYVDDVLDAIDDAFYVLDRDGDYDRYNETLREVTGYSDEEIEAMHPTDFFAEEDADAIAAGIEEAFESGHARLEADLVTEAGERIPYELTASRLEAPDGRTIVAGIGRDISERRRHERRVEALVENSPNPIYIKDREGYYELVNDAMAELYGATPAELEGAHTGDVNDTESTAEILETDREVIETGEPVTAELTTTVDGRERTFIDNKYPYRDETGEVVGVMGISQDVTERRERERELERKERRYQAVFEDPNILVGLLDPDGTVLDVNPTAMEYVGVEREEVTGEPFWETPWWSDDETARQEVRDWVDRAAAGEYVDFEADLTRPDGREYTVSGYFRPVTDEDGEVVSIIVSDRDVTERVQHERELERQASLLDALFEQIPLSVYVKDEEARFLRSSIPYLHEDMPDDEGFVRGKTDRDLFPSLGEETYADDLRVIEEGERIEGKLEYHPERDDWVQTWKSPWRGEDGEIRGLIGVSLSVDDQKERQRKLRRLHETSRELIEAEDREQVAEVASEAAGGILGLPMNSVHLYDHDAEALAPVATSDETQAVLGEPPTVREGLAWSVYREGEPQIHDDVREAEDLYNPETDVRSEMILPLDEHGVFIASSTEVGAFDETDVTLARVLAASVQSALDRAERKRALERYREFTDDVLDAADDMFYVVGEDLQFRRWNDTLPEATGYDDDEIAEMHPLDFFADEHEQRILSSIQSVLETGHDRMEVDLLTSEGRRVPYEFVASRLEDPDGETVLVGVGRDVSDRVERERKLEALVENTTNPIFIKDREGVYRFANHAAADYFDAAPEDVVGKTDEELFDSDEGTLAARADDRRVIETGETITEEVVRVIDGEEYVFLDNKYPYRDETGEIVGVMGISREVTERKERERELAARSVAMEEAIDGMAILSEDGTYEFVNQSHAEVYGYDDPEAMLGESWKICYDDDQVAYFEEAVMPTFREEGSWRGEAVGTRADGSTFPQELSLTVLEDGRMVCIVRDITERKERERELRETKRRLELALEGTNTGVWEWDPETDAVTWNETQERLVGLDPGEFEGTFEAFERRAHPDDLPRVSAALERTIEDHEPFQTEFRIRHEDGGWVWVGARGQVLEDGDGAPRMVGINNDITDRKERERELRATKERLERFIEGPPVGVFSLDSEGRVTLWNEAMEEIFGWSADEVLGEPYPAVPDDAEDEHEDLFERCLDGESFSQVELQRERKDGTLVDVSLSTAPIYDEDGEVVEIASFFLDITERKERERELERTKTLLQQTQRLAGVGGWQMDVRSEPYGFTITDELRELYGIDGNETVDHEDAVEFIHPEDRARVEDVTEAAIEAGEGFEIEYRIVPEDGQQRWIRELGDPVLEDGEVVAVRGSMQDITQRKQRERELERTTNLLQQAQELARIGGWEVDLASDPPEVEWTDELYRIHDLPVGADLDGEDPAELFHPEDRELVDEVNERLREDAEPYDVELRLAGDEERWVRAIGEPVTEDGEIVRLRGSVQEITDRKEHERTLETLHEVARDLLGAADEQAVADLAVEAARDVLHAPAIALYLLDPETAGLEPAAFTGEFVDRCGTPSVGGGAGDSVLWNAFATRTPTVFDDGASLAGGEPLGEETGGLAIPIGDHGVLTLVTPSDEAVGARTRRVVETLVATTEAALDRLDSEASLRERETELERHNRRLQQQIGINELIRSIDQALIRADSREEIETVVTERLAESEDVAFAWIGSLDAAGDHLEPRAWAGVGQEYLDATPLGAGSSEPAVRTARRSEPTVVDAVVEDLKAEEWRKQALVSNFSSAISVPIAYDEYTYGVLTIYGTEPEPFGDVERSVFEELGENVASSIKAVETQQALHADTYVELTLAFEDSEEFLARVARASGCTIEYVGLATYTEDETRVFFEVEEGDPEAVAEALEELVSVEEFRSIGGADGGHLFEAAVAGGVLAGKLVRHGASPRSMSASAGGLDVVVDVPTTTDVREFVEMLGDEYADVELVSRRDVSRDVETRQEHVGSLLEGLTERQLEVLRTAYFAGFFEWPRESTGEEIADLLGVSQPTVNRHVRHGLARLLAELFEEEAPPAALAE